MMNKGLKNIGYLNKIFNSHDLHYSGADPEGLGNGPFQMAYDFELQEYITGDGKNINFF
jgi:hypothetical protein